MIRRVTLADAPTLTAIYNRAIETGHCTCHQVPFSVAERAAWIAQSDSDKTPIFVYERDGLVLGYGYLSSYRTGRQGLATVAEISYYVDFGCHGKGVGSALVSHLLEIAGSLGYETLLATLLDSNEKSKALARKFGFECWGLLPDVAKFKDRRDSLAYYGRRV